MKLLSYDINVKSFFQRGVLPIDDDFGIFLITGYQGSGKTFFAVYLLNNLKSSNNKIYTNVKSLKLSRQNVNYFEKLEEIWDCTEPNCIYLIDEISKKYTKESKQDQKFYSWLQQSRKRQRIVFLLTQEYLQVPTWLRGIARFVYTTNKVPLLPIFYTNKGVPVLDDETKEWTIVPKQTYIYKRTKKVANCYDTMEPVNVL